ncbi:hypothetical protein PRECH8_10790 [Insulibacter thermoxylanivorax]|uniref:Uncharacterized protein n=1 Tax=Insulibacter thermoxylanivorax TaxID=2749268 RepID=A0A916QE70_9BACL|nr:hypothetical protein [Insulibacter thermoxylanivorax]GFR37783.1 hypothetical protein PRECH8_10790 [Insulibacter thermoxylanivorax]
MPQSFHTMKLIPSQMLQDRLENIQELLTGDLEQYEIVRDRETGEHYLHYVYLHVDLSGSGEGEYYHQLLPLETDDVLAMVLGEQDYTYPDNWLRPYLRNGPEDKYVWFDPEGMEDTAEQERIAGELRRTLQEFKKRGKYDEDSVRQMLDTLDKLLDGERPDDLS